MMDRWQTLSGREGQALLDSIPGGVQRCLNDDEYTILEVNQGFLELFGFSREELAERFGGRYIEMIHPSDRPEVRREAARQLSRGEKLTLSYRALCRDGSYKWVVENAQLNRGEGGESWFLCVMLDDTEPRDAREELRLSLERHRIIMDQTDEIIFEWDIPGDAMIFSKNWDRKFGYAPRYEGLGRPESVFRHIHPDDVHALTALMKSAKDGNAYSTAEIRIRNDRGKDVWCRIRATDQYDRNGSPLKAVGVITDIDEEKRLIDDLRRRAERDALTGLYNREETELQIRRHLEEEPQEFCALYMIDTDNFKLVNDTQGHLFGDAVLSEMASGMKRLTRATDVVGRIGGDEFTIFLKDIPSREMAARKAAGLLDMFQSLFQEEKQSFEVTCSIGVALYPDDGRSFSALYHSADQALYQAKSKGKNQYVLFDAGETAPVDQTGYSSLGSAIDSDRRSSGVPGDLVNYVFQILYDAGDVDHAIQLILEIVGKRFDVSRAYIFENSADGKYTDNTYEWCNAGIAPQRERLQHVPYEGLNGYKELFRDNSVFYCRDIRALTPAQTALFEEQGIRSTLQCAIRNGEDFHGFVGFDECTGLRMWTKEEVGMLSLIAQMLTTFLLKQRATERDRQMAVQLNSILDAQDAYIYAIGQDTYELLYLNHRTRELDPSARVGTACYRAFFGRSAPCGNCPLSGGEKEIYNPRYDVWTRVHVAPMSWGGRGAYLISCLDITDYKRMQGPSA